MCGTKDSFYLIDFGIASGYSEQMPIAPQRMDGSFNGTQDFVSLRVMQGEDVSRRDDVEALMMCLVCFINAGKLPWTTASSRAEVMRLKRDTPLSQLCKGCPPEMQVILARVRQLQFHQRPDYALLRAMLEGARKPGFGRQELEGMLRDPPIVGPHRPA